MELKVYNDFSALLSEERYKPVYEFIKNNDLKSLECKKYDITDGVYVMISTYETVVDKPEKFEAHKDYDDVQLVIYGEENIKWQFLDKCTPITEYDKEKDFQLFTAKDAFDGLLKENCFMIFTPNDAHLPKCAINNATAVKKAVFKVKR